MLHKKGYIFIPQTQQYKPLFGKSINVPKRYENIETNDFTFFEERRELKESIEQFFRVNHTNPRKTSIWEGLLEMQIAESKQEVDDFTQGNLVVIADTSDFRDGKLQYLQKWIFGPKVPNKEIEFNGVCAKLGYNGFKTFEELGDCYKPGTAKYAAKEIHRQGDNVPVTIAKFKLKILR